MKECTLLLDIQVNYVYNIIVLRDMGNLSMSRKEVVKVVSEIGQSYSYVQADNHWDYLVLEESLTNIKMHGQVITAQTATLGLSQICVSLQYHWHVVI